ncbi:MAG: SDR family oxidoreductase [Lentisphaerae bacterium]|nr:SDR family oxidoreductase [Lentisphaerota bacterium]
MTGQSRDHTLAGQWALVTGGGKRIGRAVALGLGAAGINVVVHYRSSAAEAAEVVRELHHLGVDARAVQADLDRPDEAAALVARARQAAPALDVVVNSAAIFPDSTLAGMAFDDLTACLRVNAWAPLRIALDFAALERPGSIVNILDSRMLLNDRRHAAYHVSKRALFTLTRMLALELAPRIRVNAIAPGPILPPPGKDQTYLERVAAQNPLRRWGSPSQVAESVLYLLKCEFVTGQVLFVDGGLHMKGSMYGC